MISVYVFDVFIIRHLITILTIFLIAKQTIANFVQLLGIFIFQHIIIVLNISYDLIECIFIWFFT